MTIRFIAPAGAYSTRQQATVKQTDARRGSTFSGLEKALDITSPTS